MGDSKFFKRDRDKLLGKGSFGNIVYESPMLLNGQRVAIKRIQVMNVDESFNEETQDIMKRFQHPNVLKIFSFTSDQDFWYIAFELCEGALSDCFKNHPSKVYNFPSDAEALYQMTSGLDYIHKNNFVHGDIKAENVLISFGNPASLKMSDFGICSKTANFQGNGKQTTTQVNTAPELLKTEDKQADSFSDTFSLGCLFFTFLTMGKHLFLQNDAQKKFFIPVNVLDGKYFLPGRLKEDQLFAESIIESMILADPARRANLEDIMAMLINSQYRHKIKQEKVLIIEEHIAYKNGEELLGRGTFGRVYEKILPNGQKVAIKRIERLGVKDVMKLEIAREGMMKDFNHPNVLKLYSIYNDADFMYLVLEWCDGTLNDYFNAQDPDWKGKKYTGAVPSDLNALYQLASGLDYIHRKKFVHRDLKSDNVLISSSPNKSFDESSNEAGLSKNNTTLLKISDFGFCKKTNERGSYSLGKSMPKVNQVTTAPELCKDGIGEKANQKSDIFSLGCLFFTFLTKGKHLFQKEGESTFSILLNITKGEYSLKDRLDHNHLFAKEIIEGMVKHDPNERIGLEEILKKLDDIAASKLCNVPE